MSSHVAIKFTDRMRAAVLSITISPAAAWYFSFILGLTQLAC
jgi:hypothetical protein